MAESWYPNPSVTQQQHERLVGRAMPSGVIGHPTDTAVVYAPGSGTREIRIRADKQAVVRGYGWQNDATEIVKNLTANSSTSTRTDLVVLRYSRADYSVTVQIVVGTPGSGAPSPTYNTGASGVWELPLATVVVPANSGTLIAGSAVTRKCWYLGDNGQILCTDTTRPPGGDGVWAFETNNDRWILSDGVNWSAPLEDSGATSITLDAGWTAHINRLQRRGGTAVLSLDVQRSTTLASDTSYKVGQLPAGFGNPTFQVTSSAQYESSPGQSVGLRVSVTGGVYIDVPVSVSVNADRPLVGQAVFFPTVTV